MPNPSEPGRRPRRFPLIILAPVLAVVALVAWGLGSPAGSSPDDDFHLASIWCGGASLSPTCSEGDEADERTVPTDLLVDAVCYAREGDVSADCQGDDFGHDPTQVTSTDRVNAGGLYPPVFYFVTSVFAGPDIQISVVAIRVFTAAFFVGWLVILWFLLPATRRISLVGALVVTTVPLGMSIIPSTNPSGWALLSAALLWLSLVEYFDATGRRKVALGAFALVTAVIGAGSRSDSAVYAVIAVVVAVLLTMRRDRAYLLSALLGVAVMAIALAFYLGANQSDVASTGFSGEGATPSEEGFLSLFAANTILVPGLWSGIFGLQGWQLGWLDTPMPAITSLGAFAVFAASLLLGLRTGSWRKWLALGTVGMAMWLIPVTILALSHSYVGAYVQPRYILPLIAMFSGIALTGITPQLTLARAQRVALIVVLSLANAFGLAAYMRRYISGAGDGGLNLDAGIEWWWPGLGLTPMVVLAIGSLAFSGMLVILDRWLLGVRANSVASEPAGALTPSERRSG